MPTASCLCKAITVNILGKPMAAALCHCSECRKISGSAFGFNWVLASKDVEVTGTPKTFTTTAKSGNAVISHFCSDCGVTLWRDGPATKGMMYFKAGTLDDWKDQSSMAPFAEIFTSRRLSWVNAVPNAVQKSEME
ncbi:hypothetical protein CH063_06444 [Colletotrichum higginsianum]|uniref:Duf636 domain protein n=1 Tax=Colletotrichum higginsianum (strain IMI 349063) TaxID=759273 RepID=H1V2K3_COLHI|nr:Duf636 domain protein [Colletotrichum higginsianum IMI 349063]OBR02678.1 Duf636 domain protein [Colletotrichum higginsianum IMI 349063]GJD00645.1 DUF636 domain protein [Colletotrichum higginsianum]CCF34455.1 hypothetical protein CH063_06444 [Colletotrichum higginsianum]